MSIVRTASPVRNFTIVSNDVINDARLSLEARGLLLWLLSKPENWQTNSDLLAAQHGVGRDRIRRVLRQLSDVGYMKLETLRNEAGRITKRWMIYDIPQAEEPATGSPAPGNPGPGNSGHISNTDEQRTKKQVLSASDYCPYSEIQDLYNQELPELKTCRELSTARKKAIQATWKWLFKSHRADGTPRAVDKESGLEWIKDYFLAIRQDNFIMGRLPKAEKYQNWKADIQYVFREDVRIRIIEA